MGQNALRTRLSASGNRGFVMPLNSVNTNTSAMIALQSLNAINTEYAQVQRRISTGL